MSKILILFIIVIIFSSCSLLKHTPEEAIIIIEQQQLDSIVEVSVNELIEGAWLSDYLIQNNKRPILVTSKFQNETNTFIDTLKLYESINMGLIRSGQVRVVKLDETQRQISPGDITKGLSIDFAISTKVKKIIKETSSSLYFEFSLWDDKLIEPVITINKEIE